jgi:hypothetical protein
VGDGSTGVTATREEGPNRNERIVLVVAAVVLVGALVGAFLTSSLADGLMGRDDDGGPTTADTRPSGSSPSTTTASGATTTSSPGPTATSTAPSTTTATTASAADGDAAIAILRAYLERCTVDAGLPAESIAEFQYATTPADTPTRVYVTANEPDGATATWTVDVTTRELVGADQLAQDILATCPAA